VVNMNSILSKLATYYMKLEQWLKKHRYLLFIGVAIFFILAVMNCFMVMSKADDEKRIIVIDPGHGGNDPGKVGSSGCYEKDINMEIAIKLKDSLEEYGFTVVLTRESDTNLATEGATNKKTSDMHNRVELINEAKADCFISIHQNSYTDPDVKGAQVFYYSQSAESEELATVLQRFLVDKVDSDNNRKIKAGDEYYILKKTTCPGVIIECGFLSCPWEEAMLLDENYQEKLADDISEAIYALYK